MKERPILFSAPMVRALLAGTKTQTRRIAKPHDFGDMPSDDVMAKVTPLGASFFCPYGAPGDHLYVREQFSYEHGCGVEDRGCSIWYWADGNPDYGDWTRPKPSIHMPRWASRITLEITSVRVERLKEISEADAHAESCRSHGAIREFQHLWETINGAGSWEGNPWVWVVGFSLLGSGQHG